MPFRKMLQYYSRYMKSIGEIDHCTLSNVKKWAEQSYSLAFVFQNDDEREMRTHCRETERLFIHDDKHKI